MVPVGDGIEEDLASGGRVALRVQLLGDDRGEVPARGIAHEHDAARVVDSHAVRFVQQEPGDVQAVVEARGERVLRCEAVVDGDDDAPGELRHRRACGGVALDVAGDPSAAVEEEEDVVAAALDRVEHADRDRVLAVVHGGLAEGLTRGAANRPSTALTNRFTGGLRRSGWSMVTA